MEAVRQSPLTAQIQQEIHAELDGFLDKAAAATAPILERIQLQQHGMQSERDLQDLAGALSGLLQQLDPTMPDGMRQAGIQALHSLIPPTLEAVQRSGRLLVDQPDLAPQQPAAPAAAAAAASATVPGPNGRGTVL